MNHIKVMFTNMTFSLFEWPLFVWKLTNFVLFIIKGYTHNTAHQLQSLNSLFLLPIPLSHTTQTQTIGLKAPSFLFEGGFNLHSII